MFHYPIRMCVRSINLNKLLILCRKLTQLITHQAIGIMQNFSISSTPPPSRTPFFHHEWKGKNAFTKFYSCRGAVGAFFNMETRYGTDTCGPLYWTTVVHGMVFLFCFFLLLLFTRCVLCVCMNWNEKWTFEAIFMVGLLSIVYDDWMILCEFQRATKCSKNNASKQRK